MSERQRPPDLGAILGGLKDFQLKTVEHIFRRLYTDPDPVRRFLLADEVGLGKTLVARGVIARAIHHMWESVKRIDIIYICSNADIARQNINRLNVTGEKDFALASRVTMLPVKLAGLRDRKLNFVSFTPGTSFDLKSSLGMRHERALLYHLLESHWGLAGMAPLNVFQGGAGRDGFRRLVDGFLDVNQIDQGLAAAFCQALSAEVQKQREARLPDLRGRFDDLCDRFARARDEPPREDLKQRAELVGELRQILARACIHQLEPDLIILDEFQRFKHLLEGEDETGTLARDLFDYRDEQGQARVLLVSATPYKMYTLDDEAGDEDHYQDFLRTVAFLEDDPARTAELGGLLDELRREVQRLDGDRQRLANLKHEIETRLRRVMVRTERLAVREDRNGMLGEVRPPGLDLQAGDVHSYLALQQVARQLEHGDTLEYWKSSPYLLNFMEGYELKRSLETACEKRPKAREELVRLLSRSPALLLDFKTLRRYGRIDPSNTRLRSLLEDTLGRGMWKLLWLAPALPYYALSEPWSEVADTTKRLVFSSWKVVPKVIAGLLSYEAERLMVASFHAEGSTENTVEARRRRRPLLRFALSSADGRLTGMPVLALVYPSFALAAAADPLALAARSGLMLGREEVVDSVTRRMEDLLLGLPAGAAHGPEDESWYWAAPVLLDRLRDAEAAAGWLSQPGLGDAWAGRDGAGAEAEPAAGEIEDGDEQDPGQGRELGRQWQAHVALARKLLEGTPEEVVRAELGRRPADLARVLAELALGGWAVCTLRTLGRLLGDAGMRAPGVRMAAGRAAFGFWSLFNLPESIALIRGLNGAEPYWRRVLEYATSGCLQAVLDEYLHVLRESLGRLRGSDEETALDLAEALRDALTLRTAQLGVDEVRASPRTGHVSIEKHQMRARFAVRFGDEKSDDGSGGTTRADQVRVAFNSPFWPFVLATTSVGQEGLDFHQYCHAIVHWNLPANPVDLEQREGRIHRYKGHAVRKNVARKIGFPTEAARGGDPWEELFSRARCERDPVDSDLVPYWVYPLADGARLERHVPALPLSRDRHRLEALRRSLVVYRMVFGQARQEELLEFLRRHLPEERVAELSETLRIDLSPP